MQSKNRQPGFTLIEILVVLVIVALAGAFLVIGYNQLLQRKAATAVDEIQAWLEAAADTAVLQSSVLGVTSVDNQLLLMAFFHDQWFLLANQIPLDIDEDIQLSWPESMLDNALVEGIDEDYPRPYLVLTPAGDILPEGQIDLVIGEQQAQISWLGSSGFSLQWQGS